MTWNVWCRRQHRCPMTQQNKDRYGRIMSTQQTGIVRLHARKPSWPYNENKWADDALNLNTLDWTIVHCDGLSQHGCLLCLMERMTMRRTCCANKGAFEKDTKTLMKCTQHTLDEMKSILVMQNVMSYERTAEYIPGSSRVYKQKPSQSQYERQREKRHEEITKVWRNASKCNCKHVCCIFLTLIVLSYC